MEKKIINLPFLTYTVTLNRGIYHKMLISEGHLLDTRHLLESGHLKYHLQCVTVLSAVD